MADAHPLKISYCTTCKGRLHHLRETLPANLAAERDNPNVEFVILDYGSEDGLGDWMREHYADEMATGRIRYARYETPHFEMAHAKNMAHRLATGDVVCNLDADNFLSVGYGQWLQEAFSRNIDTVTNHGAITTRLKGWVDGSSLKDTRGRIATSRENFMRLSGYNEEYSYYRGGDNDFTKRALGAGLVKVEVPGRLFGGVIAHSDAERTSHLSPKDALISQERLGWTPLERRCRRAIQGLEMPVPVNEGGKVGCGTVHINFSPQPTGIGPLTLCAGKAVDLTEKPGETQGLRSDWASATRAASHPHTQAIRR